MSAVDERDSALARRCAQGDRGAFVEAIEHHLPSLLRFARLQCEGELAANAVLLRAIERAGREIPGCADAENVLAWLLHSIEQSCAGLAGSPATRT